MDTKEEHEAPYPLWSYVTRAQRQGKPPVHRPWRERLSQGLLDDLKAWNQSWDANDGFWNDALVRQGRGKSRVGSLNSSGKWS